MPHGITVDQQGNTWVTDVALHQVLRFSKDNHDSPDLILGEAFVPGNDPNHFCKPTDVAVSSQGFVYISDGYCNSRIVVYTDDGQYVGSFGSDGKSTSTKIDNVMATKSISNDPHSRRDVDPSRTHAD